MNHKEETMGNTTKNKLANTQEMAGDQHSGNRNLRNLDLNTGNDQIGFRCVPISLREKK